VPADVRATLILSDADLGAELIRMTDSYTDQLFELPEGAARIVFPVSRLVVDPERFVDDAQEPMAARGMGVVYTRTSDGQPLRRTLSLESRDLLIRRYYDPHHERLTRAVDDALEYAGRCLILDCHSFPSAPLPYELEQSSVRPDICVGTDEYHTPDWLVELATELSSGQGFRVLLNQPFSGALVPMAHYRKEPRVWSLMIEVNRSLYMDEFTGNRSAQFDSIRRRLRAILARLLEGATLSE
jgi:N-formylglutamate amidohydrolase